MINFRFAQVVNLLGEISLLSSVSFHNEKFEELIPDGRNNLAVQSSPKRLEAIQQSKEGVAQISREARALQEVLNSKHVDRAINSLARWPDLDPPSWTELRHRLSTVRNAITIELSQYLYYQYPKQKAALLQTWKADWQAAIEKFPSVQWDAYRATDCYALEHNVAAVFYSMRILEVGLRVVAADVGLTFDLQQWHNIIDQIESSIASERKTLPRGAARNERLQFLSEAAKEFFYFKDGWRNHVAHNRADYDEHQAVSVLTHVRAFMNHLASQLSEPE